jgi:hypothetical protein
VTHTLQCVEDVFEPRKNSCELYGRTVQVEPMKPTLIAPVSQRLIPS